MKMLWFLLSLAIVFLDQITKYIAEVTLVPYQPHEIIPMLNFMLAYNTGAAFSFLSQTGSWHRWFFVLFSLIMSGFLCVWLRRTPANNRLELFSLSLILGGAIGNLIDRAAYGYVVDFIDVYYKTYHWPVFNVADSAICIGGILLFVQLCSFRSDE